MKGIEFTIGAAHFASTIEGIQLTVRKQDPVLVPWDEWDRLTAHIAVEREQHKGDPLLRRRAP